MDEELAAVDFQRFWRRLQQLGLNAYESRSYLVLLGHPRFKALELAARAHVPRQKIYEVLDSLVERGFAQVVQERTKLFSAVEPSLAIPSYLSRQRQALEQELTDNGRAGVGLDRRSEIAVLRRPGRARHAGFLAHRDRTRADRGRIPAHAGRSAERVSGVFAAALRGGPAGRKTGEAGRRGRRRCRILLEAASLDEEHRQRLGEYAAAGVEVRVADSLPMKLAVFDGMRGLVALLDPVITKPAWTSVVFDHEGMGEAMKGLFEVHWHKGRAM